MAAIDTIYNALSTTTEPYHLNSEAGIVLTTEEGFELFEEEYDIANEPNEQNATFTQLGLNFLDFSQEDPFSEIGRI